MRPSPAAADPVARLLAGYRPVPGVPDELVDASGAIRPVWRRFIDHLAGLSREELAARISLGDQHLRDAGVFFRKADGGSSVERQWPLSHVPVLIAEAEWREIEAGLTQRADLLEAVAQDLYGPNTLVAAGHLPPELVAGNREWLRPMVGVPPASGHYLHMVAFELGRAPNGQWWVMNDRTQAPSGAGFALENRVASSRIFFDLYPSLNVRRLAGFFREFRDALLAMRDDPASHAAILSPGVLSDTYFEHAYIARYLGLTLVEGEDLVVDDGRVMVRTVAGLQPVGVLWRRLDSLFADPLELAETSRIGTPGLVSALRRQSVSMVNALGSGVIETRALMAFLPRICEVLRGESLLLPNIATWWCGQPAERAHVQANIASMTISPALSTRMPFDPHDTAVLGGRLRDTAFASVEQLLETEASALVGQEAVTLSTSPALVDGVLAPRPMSIRVFLARTRTGWRVMPGGYARIGRTDDVTAVNMQQGGSVSDVWVIADQPVEAETLLAAPAGQSTRRQSADLPSRAAENLFWLGRYIERTEGYIRLKRALDLRSAEAPGGRSSLVDFMADYMRYVGLDPASRWPPELGLALSSASRCARNIRDRVSPDAWVAISELERTVEGSSPLASGGGRSAQHMGALLRQLAAFSGLVHENMFHNLGWRFLSIGRALERGMFTASILARFTRPAAPAGALDAALECGDSTLSHRRLYPLAATPASVIELLGFDTFNPRSILYQLDSLREHVQTLPGATEASQMSPAYRALLQVHTRFAIRQPASVGEMELIALWEDLGRFSDLLDTTYLS